MSTVLFAKEMHVSKMNKNHSNVNFESKTNYCIVRFATIQIGSTPTLFFFGSVKCFALLTDG